jgi:hypothetical protein
MSGEAASYYNNVFEDPRPAPSPVPPPQQDNKSYQQGPPPESQPHQDEKYRPDKAASGGHGGYDFNQAFKIEQPQFNDIWAGLLVGFIPNLEVAVNC